MPWNTLQELLFEVLKQNYPRDRYVGMERRNKLLGGVLIYARRFEASDSCDGVSFPSLVFGTRCITSSIDKSPYGVDPVRQ